VPAVGVGVITGSTPAPKPFPDPLVVGLGSTPMGRVHGPGPAWVEDLAGGWRLLEVLTELAGVTERSMRSRAKTPATTMATAPPIASAGRSQAPSGTRSLIAARRNHAARKSSRGVAGRGEARRRRIRSRPSPAGSMDSAVVCSARRMMASWSRSSDVMGPAQAPLQPSRPSSRLLLQNGLQRGDSPGRMTVNRFPADSHGRGDLSFCQVAVVPQHERFPLPGR
jgi:hypothetical protein